MTSSVLLYDSNPSQINKIACHPTNNLICTGHEDGSLKLVDFTVNKVVKNFGEAHTDAISCLTFNKSGLELYTASHDGSIKVWDLRKVNEPNESLRPLCHI